MDDNPALLKLDIPARPEAAAAARKAIGALNGSMHLVSAARLRDAELLVTELVSNAVRYGSQPDDEVSIVVRASPAVLRVEVHDFGPSFDPGEVSAPSTQHGGGWGLQIVARLAHRWGVAVGPISTVWFEIDRPQDESPPVPGPSPPE
jgi:anti-sigma regulatory factor (Ser/Thr protein kinase)